MKKITTLLLMLCIAATTYGQQTDNIFRKYKNDSGVMYLDLGGNIEQFVDMKDMKSDVKSLQVLIFSEDSNPDQSDLDKINQALGTDGYELLIQANSKEGKAKIYVIDKGEYFTEIFAMVKADKYHIFAKVLGEVYYEDLQDMEFLKDPGSFGF